MVSQKMPVHLDGCVFHKQSHGGITRVFENLIRELAILPELELHLHLWQERSLDGLPVQVNRHLVSDSSGPISRLARRLRLVKPSPPGQQYFGAQKAGVFHSTYYSTFRNRHLAQVLTVHDMIYEDFPDCFPNAQHRDHHILQKRQCIHAADVIVCDSLATKDRLLHWYGAALPHTPVEVVHLGIDCQILSASPIRPIAPEYVLHVGSRHAHKNFDGLIMAMGEKPLRNLHLLSIGGGEWSTTERSLIHKYCDGRSHYITRATDEQLASAFRYAAVVAVPSLSEGFGLPVLEAMRHNTRIACSTGGSLREVGGDVPVYFDPKNVEQMAIAIAEAAERTQDENLIGRTATHANQFSWADTARKYADLYGRFGA